MSLFIELFFSRCWVLPGCSSSWWGCSVRQVEYYTLRLHLPRSLPTRPLWSIYYFQCITHIVRSSRYFWHCRRIGSGCWLTEHPLVHIKVCIVPTRIRYCPNHSTWKEFVKLQPSRTRRYCIEISKLPIRRNARWQCNAGYPYETGRWVFMIRYYSRLCYRVTPSDRITYHGPANLDRGSTISAIW